MLRINVGCGRNPIPGWRNFDSSPSVPLARNAFLRGLASPFLGKSQRDYIRWLRGDRAVEWGDGTKTLPVPDHQADVVYASHLLEHLTARQVESFLREARRILHPSGRIRLAVPDIRKLAQDYIEDHGDADRFITETRLAISLYQPMSFSRRVRYLVAGNRGHKWMYDGPSLCRLLTRHGFTDAGELPPGKTLIPEPGGLDLCERMEQSVYVEARPEQHVSSK